MSRVNSRIFFDKEPVLYANEIRPGSPKGRYRSTDVNEGNAAPLCDQGVIPTTRLDGR